MRVAIIIPNSLSFALLSENQKVKTNVSKVNKPLWIVLNGEYFLGLSFLLCLGISFPQRIILLRVPNGASADQENRLKIFVLNVLEKKRKHLNKGL